MKFSVSPPFLYLQKDSYLKNAGSSKICIWQQSINLFCIPGWDTLRMPGPKAAACDILALWSCSWCKVLRTEIGEGRDRLGYHTNPLAGRWEIMSKFLRLVLTARPLRNCCLFFMDTGVCGRGLWAQISPFAATSTFDLLRVFYS